MRTQISAAVLVSSLAAASSANAAYMDPEGYALRSAKKITLSDRSSVVGSVGAGAALSIGSGATITGSATGNDSSFTITGPSMPASGSSNVLLNWDAVESVAPGVYGSFTARDRSTVTFTAGDYVFTSFDLGYDSVFNADTSNGDVNIYVVGNTTLSDRSRVVNLGNNDVFVMSDQNVTLGYDTTVTAAVYAFDGKVTINDRADLIGSAYSFKDLKLGYDATVNYAPSTFGAAVPSPGVASVAVLAGACACRRRRG